MAGAINTGDWAADELEEAPAETAEEDTGSTALDDEAGSVDKEGLVDRLDEAGSLNADDAEDELATNELELVIRMLDETANASGEKVADGVVKDGVDDELPGTGVVDEERRAVEEGAANEDDDLAVEDEDRDVEDDAPED